MLKVHLKEFLIEIYKINVDIRKPTLEMPITSDNNPNRFLDDNQEDKNLQMI